MRIALLALTVVASTAVAQPVPEPVPAARDIAFPGTMQVAVDARDVERGIFRVEQTIPVAGPGPVVLLYPEWLPGNHAPRGQIEKLTGLVIKANGIVLPWKRDWADVYGFQVTVPAGVAALQVSFQFVSATEADQGRVVATPVMLNLQWQSVSLYPAGWKTGRIPVEASVIFPAGWGQGTALRPKSTAGAKVSYQSVDYETLIDSPVIAGRNFKAVALGQGVVLNVVADEAKQLVIRPDQIAAHQRLVEQAVKLFGARPFDHYDFLLSLSDKLGSIGLEHHRSSENGADPGYFTEWDAGPGRRNLLPHEFTHSWNGKRRRPAGQIVPDFRTPLHNDLLWVYEGQTQFWGYVLGARAGLFTKQETLDALAGIAANLDIRRARDWRALEDTTNDPVISARRPKGWTSWQRSEDYYNEGLLIWLEVDALIRNQTGGTRSMDDFARAFLGGSDGSFAVQPYDFDDLVQALNRVAPYDWAGFLTRRLGEKAEGAPLNGLVLGGYRLTYGEEPGSFFRDVEKRASEVNLTWSIGLTIGKGGHINNVVWDGPAFNAGLTVAGEIIAVNGRVYSEEGIKEAIRVAKGDTEPVRLIVKTGDRVREVPVIWNGGLRYPRLEKTATGDSGIDLLLKPRP
ncbi:MAG: hypothetical protein RL367_138 [Pseudomonadota bacterium]